jgi:hypothetical protein
VSSQKAGPAGGEQPRGHTPFPQPPWLLFGAFLSLALALLGIYGAVTHSALLPVVQSVIGICALMIGGLLGFVFGIPRTLTRDAPGEGDGVQGAREEGDARRPALNYRPSTNLEQVSDWLTKILIGVGLVEFARMSDALSRVGRFVADDLLAGGQARHPGASVLTQAVIIGFSTGGFLAGFLWTRIHYGGMQAQADRDLLRRIGEIEPAVEMLLSGEVTPGNAPAIATSMPASTEPAPVPPGDTGRTRGITRSDSAIATRSATRSESAFPTDEAPRRSGSDALPAPIAEAIERFRGQPVGWNSDPGEDVFPEITGAQRNGRQLEARIVSALPKVVVIRLSVTGTGRNPLAGTVRFLLHPAFHNPVHEVPAVDGRAELNISASGCFTVVALADNGRTVLKYPLNQIPDAPDWFVKS